MLSLWDVVLAREMLYTADIWLVSVVSCLVSGKMGIFCSREKSTAETGQICQHRNPVMQGFNQSPLSSPTGLITLSGLYLTSFEADDSSYLNEFMHGCICVRLTQAYKI